MTRAPVERCTECAAPLTGGACGSCAPTGRPVDKGERRLEADAAAHEKEQWDQRLVNRKVHPRARRASSSVATKKTTNRRGR